MGSDFVVTVRYGETDELVEVRRRAESEPNFLRRGPSAVLYAIMDRIVNDYGPVVEGDPGASPPVSRRIYELSREVIQFHQATQPLAAALLVRWWLRRGAGGGDEGKAHGAKHGGDA